jgi:hypothetical protein
MGPASRVGGAESAIIAGVTDYEPYLADPAEPVVPGKLARWRPLLSVAVALLVVLALVFLWLDAQGQQDPALTVPDAPTAPAPGTQPTEAPATPAP